MYCLMSPAKKLDEKTAIPFNVDNHLSEPVLINHVIELMKTLKNKDVIDLQELMGVSAKIAELTKTGLILLMIIKDLPFICLMAMLIQGLMLIH